MAGEIGILSRNILFENVEDSMVSLSPVILHTPDISQVIQGVEFNVFGDTTVAEQNPIHFKQSRTSTESIVSKNSVRYSKSRCINIDTTNNVISSDNVLHYTLGHYFAVQGYATGNVFRNSIDVETRKKV